MRTLILIVVGLAVSACSTSRRIMKDCEEAPSGLYICTPY